MSCPFYCGTKCPNHTPDRILLGVVRTECEMLRAEACCEERGWFPPKRPEPFYDSSDPVLTFTVNHISIVKFHLAMENYENLLDYVMGYVGLTNCFWMETFKAGSEPDAVMRVEQEIRAEQMRNASTNS